MKKTEKCKKIPELDKVLIEARFIEWLSETFFNAMLNAPNVDANDSYVVAAAGLTRSIGLFNRNLEAAYHVLSEKREQENKKGRVKA